MTTEHPATRTTSGWTIGRVGGVPLILAPSWVLIAAVLLFIYYPTVRGSLPEGSTTTVVVVTAAFVVMLFVSVLLHELAHGLTASRYGLRPREYVLTFWGGHTAFEKELPSPGPSALVAAAGPAANLLIAVVAWLVWSSAGLGEVGTLLAQAALFSNAFVAGFNLVPGLPLDGGRVLEALVWKLTGNRIKGLVAGAWGGRIFAIGLVLWAFVRPLLTGEQLDLSSAIWWLLIASFIWAGASQALNSATLHRRAGTVDLRALATPAAVLPATSVVADADRVLHADGETPVVLLHAGHPVAVVDPDAARAVPPGHRETTPLHAVARRLVDEQVLQPLSGSPAVEAVAKAQRHGPSIVVFDGYQVLGVVAVAAVAQALGQGPRRTAP